MSTEEAELTFIRCPSCRSLVPAVASRCRMCGHNFSEASSSVSPSAGNTSKESDPDYPKSPEKNEVAIENTGDQVVSAEVKQSSADVASDRHDSPNRITNFLAEQELREKVALIKDNNSDDEEEPSAIRRRRRRRRRQKAVQSEQKIVDNLTRSDEKMENYSVESKTPTFNNPIETRNGVSRQADAQTGKDGMLVGWFVSYGVNQAGASQEIRSGQFFIGRQRLRDNDLLIQDDTVSTPHLLIRAADQGGFLVQDLLSEEGTYLKRSGGSEFVRCEEPTQVSHGDTLRIGRYETLVCLLPKD